MSAAEPAEALGLRRMRETRAALVEAARESFAADGFDAPSLDAICRRAGLTRGAFYGHFRDREELIEAVQARESEAFLQSVMGAAAEPDLAGIVERFVDVFRRRRRGDEDTPGQAMPIHRSLWAAQRNPGVRADMVRAGLVGRASLIEAADRYREAGHLDPRIGSEELADFLLVLSFGVMVIEDLDITIDLSERSRRLLELLGPPGSGGTDES